ncbi:hypothetical protein J437_LFUL000682 [Ladona fulva]|uniref:DAZ-associated protein 2 n=1 Tax=Ladona fulva TaxID=123851 RepID=A0A8K0K3E1_LADFU|nr:hypothetical protein J437_LFUL000682 [Ladona fulva]
MSDKKAYPGQAQAGFVPTAPPSGYGVPGANPYGVFPAQAQLYAAAAAQGPPPTYDQSLTHQVVGQQVYPPTTGASVYAAQNYQAAAAAAAAAAQGYPLGYPVYSPMQAYYPSLTYSYPGMQPAPLRSTVMIPNGFDAGARFDGIAQPVMPPPPPGVAANAAQLAAMAGHNVALSQKKGSFLTGGSDGGYTFW